MSNSQKTEISFLMLVLILFVFFLPQMALAKPPKNVIFERLSIKEGLSNAILFDIVQDKTGFIWIATNNGLNKYDGYRFTSYLPDSDNPGSGKTISSSVIIKLMIDSQDLLWIGSAGGGLDCYDPEKDVFTHYQHNPDNPDSISFNSIYDIKEDEQGHLWIATLGGGVNVFDRKTGKFKHFRNDPQNKNSLGNDIVYSILPSKNNSIWVGLSNGLDHLDLSTGIFQHFTHDPKDPGTISPGIIPGLLNDYTGQLWTTSFGGGLNKYDEESGSFIHYRHDPLDPGSLSYNDQIRILEDSQKQLWIPTHGGGLDLYDREKDNFIHYKHDPGNITSLSFNTMVGGFEDHSEILWFFTYGGGISKYDRRTDWFELIKAKADDPLSLSNNDVHAIFEDSRKQVWIGTERGLNRYNRDLGKFKQYLHDPDNKNSICGNSIWAIDEDSKGNLWVATNLGICRMDRKTEKFTWFRHDPDNPDSLSEDRTWSLCVDDRDLVWIGTQSGGVNRYNPKTEKFKTYPLSNFVLLLKTDRDGDVWVGAEKGLFKYNPLNDQFKYYGYEQKKTGMIGPGTVSAILKDTRGNIWIGNPGGLFQYNKKTDSFIRFTQKSGLIDIFVSGIVEEKPGVLWISTAKGLSKFNYDNNTFENYNIGVFNRGVASIKTSTGDILFGTPDGLFQLYPDNLQKNTFKPTVVLTSIKVLNKEIETKTPVSALKFLELSYKDQLFSFEFSALDYSDTNRNRYKYKLEGFDKDWIVLDAQRHYANYTNIPGGNYTFQVMGSNNDGVWNSEGEGVSLKLKITPPFWETTLFYIFANIFILTVICVVLFYVIKLQREISERKKSEEALTRSEKNLKNAQELASIGDWDWNMITDEVVWSEETYRIFGKDKRTFQLSFEEFEKVFHPGYIREIVINGKNAGNENGLVFDKEYKITRETTGIDMWLNIKGETIINSENKPIRTRGTIQDITLAKQFAITIQESEQFLSRVISQNPSPMLIANDKGTSINCNKAFLDMLHLTEEQVIGKYNAFEDANAKHLYKKLYSVFNEGKTFTFEERWNIQTSSDEESTFVYLNGIVFPIINQSGIVTNVVFTGKDVTKQKLAMVELKEKEAQLQRSQKMETVGILAGGIAHDFNNLLYIISGTSELLIMDADTKDQELLFEIVKATKRGADLVKQLMAFSRKSEMNLYAIRLNSEISRIKKMLDRLLPRMITIDLDLADNLSTIKADKGQIEQVILNLCLNAKDAMPEGGALTIRTKNSTVDENLTKVNPGKPIGLKEGKCVILTVSDTGYGMDRKTKDHIFDPFFTTKGIGKGTGLGLSVIYGIVEGHHGYITCESELGKGTTFKIYFPATSDDKTVSTLSSNEKNQLVQGTETILIVDDEEGIVNMMDAILKRTGYSTFTADTGESALEIYTQNSKGIDLVLLDLGMPGMGGKKTLKKLLEFDPDIKVIVTSGYLDEGLVADDGEAAKASICKPFINSELLALVRNVLDDQEL